MATFVPAAPFTAPASRPVELRTISSVASSTCSASTWWPSSSLISRLTAIRPISAQILPLLRQAKALNPHLQIIASPWSPPAWMKTNSSLIGGRLIDDPRIYRSYALYLLKFVQAYRANGVTVNAITVQNEPQNRTPSGYPGTDMPSAQEEKVIADLGPMLRDAGLRTQIFAYDHNWSEHPNDIAATP